MKLDAAVNSCLEKMHGNSYLEKGSAGEQAAFQICESLYQQYGGIVYHSYSFKADKMLPGNIKRGSQGLYREAVGSTTEIDVLLVTPYRVFPIEVKAYKAKEIVLTDDGIDGCFQTEKSPVHQNEMHCAHLYPHILAGLPHGKSEFIRPIVVFVDKCNVYDRRSAWQKEYIPVTILNQLRSTLLRLNVPVENRYRLDLGLLDTLLNEAQVSVEKKLPVRECF